MPIENAPPPAAAPAGPRTMSPASPEERSAVKAELGPMLAELKKKREANERDEAVEDDSPDPPAEGQEAAGEGDATEGPEDDDPDATAAAAEEEGKKKPDPKTSRGMEQLAKRELRVREMEQTARREHMQREQQLQEREQQLVARAKKAEDFERRWKSDPFGAVDEAVADLPPAELSALAIHLAKRVKAASDPDARAQLEAAKRARDAANETKTATQELAELKKKLEDKEKAEIRERAASEYMETVLAVPTDELPLLSKALKGNAKQTRLELRRIAEYIVKETGNTRPDPSEVVKGWETWKEHQLRAEFGDEIVETVKKKPAAAGSTTNPPSKIQTPAAGETKRPRPTISNDLGRSTPPARRTLTRDEEIEEVKRAIKEGRANDGS